MNSKSVSNSQKQPWYKSPWVIGWLLLVIIVLSVNTFMIYQSMNNYPGLVVDDFYERGQDYEENIVKKLENNQRWKTEFKIVPVHVNKQTVVAFAILDQQGKPALAEKITLFAYRPANAKKDFSVVMDLSADKKFYQSTLVFDSKGKWDLLASVVIDGTEVNYAKSIFVND